MRVNWAENARRAAGLSSSVRLGIVAARHSAGILIMPADMANLEYRDLERLAHRWLGAPRCVVARRIGLCGATPLILPRWLYASAVRIRGDAGLRDFIGQLPADQRLLIDLPSAAADVDTRYDLINVRRRFRSSR